MFSILDNWVEDLEERAEWRAKRGKQEFGFG